MSHKKIVIIGSGPAGEAAARKAVSFGAEVLLIEKSRIGGLCLNWGCIPSKALLDITRMLRNYKHAVPLGLQGSDLSLSWQTLQQHKEKVVQTIQERLSQTFKRLGIKLIEGKATFNNAREIIVGKESISFDAAIIATGSSVFFPPPFSEIKNQMMTSDKILSIPQPPESLAIVGGGAVGCEFACLFHEVGTKVTLIEKMEGLLPGEDQGIRQALEKSFKTRGIEILTNTTVSNCTRDKNAWQLSLSHGDSFHAQEVLVCVGRKPNVQDLQLKKAGVTYGEKGIGVNQKLETNHPNIYAVGDVNGLSLLAHAGSAQGDIAVESIFGGNRTYHHEMIPRCLYTWPEIASVGEWKWSAEKKGIRTKAQRAFFAGSGKATADGDTEGFIQIVKDADSDKLLGAQIIGSHASELIHIISVALSARMTRKELSEVVFAHPTLSESIKEALLR